MPSNTPSHPVPMSSSRPVRGLWRKLAWNHWLHAVLIAQLLVTGAFLYFPYLRTKFVQQHMFIRAWHLDAAVAYVILLGTSLVWTLPYLRRLRRRRPKRLHLYAVYLAGLGWALSGLVMWGLQSFPVTWRDPATQLHDALSLIIGPWVLVHVAIRAWAKWGKPIGVHRAESNAEPAITLRSGESSWNGALSRRQFLIYGSTAIAAFVAGGVWKWFRAVPLPPISTALPKQRGSFRLYNVAESTPQIRPHDYRLQVDGLVDQAAAFSFTDLANMPQGAMTRDFHCVTGWSVTNVQWTGVPLSEIIQRVKLRPEVQYMTVYSLDGLYFDSYTRTQFENPDIMLATGMDGAPLQSVQGGPCRIIFPALYGYKSVKWVGRITFDADRKTGYWEQRGYDLNGELPRA